MNIKTDKEQFRQFLSDESNYQGDCSKVYFPENDDDIFSILKEARKEALPVTIAGAGTGLTGAAVPESGIVISMEKFDKIMKIDEENMIAELQAGVTLSAFQQQLKSKGLLYPPDPTETDCFIGGTIATNASGAKTFRYGPTRNFVEALSIIMPDGDRLELRRGEQFAKDGSVQLKTEAGRELNFSLPNITMPRTKNAAGYYCAPDMDLIDLFIGSEGTLGIITKAKLRIAELPQALLSAVAFFPSENDALDFVRDARDLSQKASGSSQLSARALEFFDGNSLAFLSSDYPQIDPKAKAAVWFEQEQTPANEDELTEKWFALIIAHNGMDENIWAAVDEKDRKVIRDFRHAVSAKVNEYIAQNNFRKLGTDVAVPDSAFKEFYFDVKNLVADSEIHFLAYGHFGNSHLHLNMLPKTESEFQAGKKLYRKICEMAVSKGGTVSAEHGIGKIKREYLEMQYGNENINAFRNLKKVFDPAGILGRNTMFLLNKNSE